MIFLLINDVTTTNAAATTTTIIIFLCALYDHLLLTITNEVIIMFKFLMFMFFIEVNLTTTRLFISPILIIVFPF